MIKIYEQWGYEKIYNKNFVLYYTEYGEACRKNVSFRQLVAFLRDKNRNKYIRPFEDLQKIYNRYPYLTKYDEEVSGLFSKQMLIGYLLIAAIENGDEQLSDYVLSACNLSEQKLKGRIIESFKKIKFNSRRNGENYFDIVAVRLTQNTPKTIIYNVNDDFCRNKDRRRLFLTEQAKAQLDECVQQTDKLMNEIWNCRQNEYLPFDFNGKRLWLKKLSNGVYNVVTMKMVGGCITEIRMDDRNVDEILRQFGKEDLVSWSSSGNLRIVLDSIVDGSFPLMVHAKQTEDTYLEYELKYQAGIATDDEIRYLESKVVRNRFIARREVYDVDSVELISAKVELSKRSYFSRWKRWVVKIIIDGFERECSWTKGDDHIDVWSKNDRGSIIYHVCKISEQLREKFDIIAMQNPYPKN
ncbi:MAG: hypothetical protein K2M36_00045 [Clostridia bacterium]|nr:hypothetical protein [Clostridia bacterium]